MLSSIHHIQTQLIGGHSYKHRRLPSLFKSIYGHENHANHVASSLVGLARELQMHFHRMLHLASLCYGWMQDDGVPMIPLGISFLGLLMNLILIGWT